MANGKIKLFVIIISFVSNLVCKSCAISRCRHGVRRSTFDNAYFGSISLCVNQSSWNYHKHYESWGSWSCCKGMRFSYFHLFAFLTLWLWSIWFFIVCNRPRVTNSNTCSIHKTVTGLSALRVHGVMLCKLCNTKIYINQSSKCNYATYCVNWYITISVIKCRY